MPARPRGRGFRGGGRGNFGGDWMRRGGGGGRGYRDGGGGNYRGGGRGFGHRGGYRPDHHRQGNKDFHNYRRPRDPKKLLSDLEPEEQLALTSALIKSVLKNDASKDWENPRDRNFHSRHGGSHREGRGGYFREESRERRYFGEDRRPHDSRLHHEEGRGRQYEREKASAGSPHYRNKRYPAMPRRRPSPHGRSWPPRKRQR